MGGRGGQDSTGLRRGCGPGWRRRRRVVGRRGTARRATAWPDGWILLCCRFLVAIVATSCGGGGLEGAGRGWREDEGRREAGHLEAATGGGGACLAPTLRRGGHRATARAGRGLGSGRMGAILGSHCSLPIVCVVVVLTKTVDHGSTILHSTMTT